MAQVKERVPAIEGWFSTGDEPALIGSRCRSCGNYSFPAETFFYGVLGSATHPFFREFTELVKKYG